MRQFWVYILTSRSGVLYIGVTNDLERRVFEHKKKRVPGFTARYNVDRLVFYEAFRDPAQAIEAEKRIKGWKRDKKVALIESRNPQWNDLSAEWEQPGEVVLRTPRADTRKAPQAILSAAKDRGLPTRAGTPEILRSPRLPQDDRGDVARNTGIA
jgi:putative endonuclease